jgi:hypothetical protein
MCRRRSALACVVPARTSEPPCFSVIDMPAVIPTFVAGTFSSGSYSRLASRGSYIAARSGLLRSCRHYRIRHRDRADVAGLGRPHRGLGGADDVRARAVVGPRRGVQAVADRDRHQLVVGRVVLDLVDAVAVAVVGAQDRLVAVGELAPALRLALPESAPSSVTSSRPHSRPRGNPGLGQYR